MTNDRRGFLERLVAGSALAAGLGVPEAAHAAELGGLQPDAPAGDLKPLSNTRWDLSWIKRIRGKHRAVFDNPGVDGTGIIRGWIWMNQCRAAFGSKDDDCTAVVVLRHGAVALALTDASWERWEFQAMNHDTGKREPLKYNPLLSAGVGKMMSGSPPSARAMAEGLGLETLIQRGAIVLGCEFAFEGLVGQIAKKEGVEADKAAELARAGMMPGITLVPSGFFALQVAQQKGCTFVTHA
jgi:hypothetical protein